MMVAQNYNHWKVETGNLVTIILTLTLVLKILQQTGFELTAFCSADVDRRISAYYKQRTSNF